MSSNPLPRITQKIFGENAPTNELAVFGTMSSGMPQYSNDVAMLTNSTAYSQGFQDAVVDGEAPFLEETNGLFYGITSQLAYLFQKGVAEYDEGTEYFTGSLCQRNNGLYISTVDNNIGLDPLANAQQWVLIASADKASAFAIGDPIPTLSNTLQANEIWLEGATVLRDTYPNLYAIYGDEYGENDGSTNFVLPDARGRVLWGSDSFGYIEAGLPNIVGALSYIARTSNTEKIGVSGAFYDSGPGSGLVTNSSASRSNVGFNASKSNPIYSSSDTVQPPSLKVRVKTRFE